MLTTRKFVDNEDVKKGKYNLILKYYSWDTKEIIIFFFIFFLILPQYHIKIDLKI